MKIEKGRLYVADLNPRMGTEPGKLRPVIVIQSNLLNDIGHPSTWILPCTTRLTPPNQLRVRLPSGVAENKEECDVMVDLSRSIDNRRFRIRLGILPSLFFDEIIEKLKSVGGF